MVEEQQVLLHVGFGDNTASFINVRFFASLQQQRRVTSTATVGWSIQMRRDRNELTVSEDNRVSIHL